MVAQALTCPECGGGIPSDARTLGLCPRCLLSNVAEAEGAARRTGAGGRFVAPDVDDLAGEFPRLEVIDFLGQGGMGAVYRARQTDLDREVALKIIPRTGVNDPAFGERFGLEARALASLSHPNVVTAYEFGRSGRFDYLLMELVRGPNLREVLQAGGVPRRLSPHVAIQIVRELGNALDYAHRRGVTHRDIKPENILLEPTAPAPESLDALFDRGVRVRVVDFGLAKLRGPDSMAFSLTAPDQRVGTGVYMAPEQLEGRREVDARADVYAVGVVLYEMLTGELPVGRFPPPSRTPGMRGVGRRLDAIVFRCLEKDPDRRYPDAASLCWDLARLDRWGGSPGALAAAAAVAVVALSAAAVGVVAYRTGHRPVASTSMSTATSAATATPPTAPAGPSLRPLGSATPPTTQELTRPAAPLVAPEPGTGTGTGPAPRIPGSPAFPPPYAGLHRPFVQDDWYQAMVRQHGRDRIVTVRVDGLPGNVSPFITRRLGQLSGTGNVSSSGSADSLTVQLAPVRDVQKLADKIDFGTVQRVDADGRVIDVLADRTKLPPPLPPVVKDVHDPRFYARNLEDLGSWDPERRKESLRRLKDAPPDPALRPQVMQAVLKFLSVPDTNLRKEAIDTLVGWGGPAAVDPLLGLLNDQDHWVKLRAIESLGKLGDARAAEPLAQLLGTDQQRAAAEALKNLGGAAEPAVRGKLHAPDPKMRAEAARLLGDIGTAASLPALEEAAATGEIRLSSAAKRAMEDIRKRAQARPVQAP